MYSIASIEHKHVWKCDLHLKLNLFFSKKFALDVD